MPAAVVQRFIHMSRVSGGAVAPPVAGDNLAPKDAEQIKWLYDVLTILDAKAGALLAFDGLILAAASLMYDKLSENVLVLKVLSLLLIIVSLIAALACLLVARVSYSFLGEVDLTAYSNAREIDALGLAVEERTERLARAWRVSIGAVGLFIFVIVVKVAFHP